MQMQTISRSRSVLIACEASPIRAAHPSCAQAAQPVASWESLTDTVVTCLVATWGSYTYNHTCTHTYMFVYIYIYIRFVHTCTNTYMHTYIHTYIHTCIIHTYIHAHIPSFVCCQRLRGCRSKFNCWLIHVFFRVKRAYDGKKTKRQNSTPQNQQFSQPLS